jgi:hypothetical protein
MYLDIPSGLINGVNAQFDLSAVPATLLLFKNGLFQTPGAGNDYTLFGKTVVFVTGNIPQVGDTLSAMMIA